MSLEEKLELVVDRESFLEFVSALVDDWNDDEKKVDSQKLNNQYSIDSDSSNWQNETIGNFLEAATAWANATSAITGEIMLKEPSWRAFAEFLYAGKIYE